MSNSAPIQWESLPLPVRLVMERLESKGFQIFLVGGCLRDLLRGGNPQDYDLASTVPPEEMEQLLAQGTFYDLPDHLIEAANAHGGSDNITALLLAVEPTEVEHG